MSDRKYRFYCLMRRISRDKYLFPSEVCDLGLRVSLHCGYASDMLHRLMFECSILGMLRGHPPVFHFEKGFSKFLIATKTLKTSEEMMILLLKIKGNYHGHYG